MSGFNTKHGRAKAIDNSAAIRHDMAKTYAQQVAKCVLDCRQQGMAYHRIVEILNLSGYSPPRGNRWHVNQVQRIVRLLKGHGGPHDLNTRRILFLAKTYKEKHHADQFVDGKLHCKRLSWFKTGEMYTDSSRIDVHEGLSQYLQPNKVTLEINSVDLSKDLARPLEIYLDRYQHVNLFCMHAGHSGDFINVSHNNIRDFENFVKIPDACKEFGDHTVFITNVGEFIRRVESACRKKDYKLHRKLVSYYNPAIFHGTINGIEAVFMKRDEYKDQREFRFVIDTGIAGIDPIDLYIGDMRDISMRCNIEEANRTLSLSLPD